MFTERLVEREALAAQKSANEVIDRSRELIEIVLKLRGEIDQMRGQIRIFETRQKEQEVNSTMLLVKVERLSEALAELRGHGTAPNMPR